MSLVKVIGRLYDEMRYSMNVNEMRLINLYGKDKHQLLLKDVYQNGFKNLFIEITMFTQNQCT